MISLWRKIHLFLAILISLFLIVVSITGTILAIDVVINKIKHPYKVDNFEELNIAQTITSLKKEYPEITEISIDHNQFVELKGISENGDEVNAIVNPNNGKIIAKPLKESKFIKDITGLHRSLFLHETGRFIVGVVSFLLFVIVVTGIVMIIKRQKGVYKFFSKIHNDFFAQWFHIVVGRWLLLPIFVIVLTATFLFAKRFKFLPEEKAKITTTENKNTEEQVLVSDFPIFKNTPLSEVKKIEFPFIEDDPEENYIVKLKSAELEVNAFSGEVTKQKNYPMIQFWADLSLNLHTGRTNILWAIVLGLASLGILGFIYTGFAITLRRTRSKIKNKFTAQNSEIIILVGTENGTTLGFANEIQKQLLNAGQKVFLAYLNQYQSFDNAKKIIVFTSTYGEGDAPTNADKFETLLGKIPQKNRIEYSVVGFGSKAYTHFCGFAIKVNTLLKKQAWAEELVGLHSINDRSPEEFVSWVEEFSTQSGIALTQNTESYQQEIQGLSEFKVISKTDLDAENEFFSITLATEKAHYHSGDILAIYPKNNHIERQYSIGRIGDNIQLFVKLHTMGLGSQFLYQLKIGDVFQAKVLENKHFHFPKNVDTIAMIANGTGIAPFLGMMQSKVKKHLYCGFRFKTPMVEDLIHTTQNQGLESFKIGYSRGENPRYVMDLIREDEEFFAQLLKNNGVIMICGALAMQKNVEDILEGICKKYHLESVENYKSKGKILTDCY